MMKSAAVGAAIVLLVSCAHPVHKRMIVLGVDGMDPHFVESHWAQLPNLQRLRDEGSFSRLATTTPPQSPVAWATFSTGLDPVQHGIFDFVERDPAVLQPMSSFAETLPPAHTLRIGPYELPLSRAQVRSFRKGRTFWEMLAAHDVPVTVIRMPGNYPPVAHGGTQLAGMGTPDLEGTYGTFTYYTDDPLDVARDVPGGRFVPVALENGRVVLPIEGPENTLRRDHAKARLNMIADVDGDAGAARFAVGGRQFIVKEGEWSPWVSVQFPLMGPVAGVSAMFRVYAKQLRAGIRIYRTPLNIDPEDPALPVSAPSGFSRELAERIGPFYTQGIAEDTAALRQGVFTRAEYLEQSRMVGREHESQLRDALAQYRDGLLFFYFSEVDQNSHMLWGRHDDELLATYRAVDGAIGRVIEQAGDAEILVMSDHGFAAFDHAVDLNAWLRGKGYLAMKDGRIDWSGTKAYAMGLNGVYVNLAGREKYGIVHDGAERDELVSQLADALSAERPAIERVVRVPRGGGALAPDLEVGYAPGYRASWQTALGETSGAEVVFDNDDAWIADHCIAAEAVPGVLLANRKLRVSDPRLKDLTVTILREFGVGPDREMTGRPVF